MKAWAWASGLIEFGEVAPEGTFLIDGDVTDTTRGIIEAMARHDREDGVLLVPGVPEAVEADDALQAVSAFMAWRKRVRQACRGAWAPDEA